MRISKIKDVKTPERGTAQSAGIDFFVPNDFEETLLESNKHIRIGSGIRADVPTGYMLCAFNKSGVALAGLSVGACVVDEDYQGEISLHLFNETDKSIVIKPGQKLVQFILIPVFYDTIEVVNDDEMHPVATERGSGGFGSTGNGLDIPIKDICHKFKNIPPGFKSKFLSTCSAYDIKMVSELLDNPNLRMRRFGYKSMGYLIYEFDRLGLYFNEENRKNTSELKRAQSFAAYLKNKNKKLSNLDISDRLRISLKKTNWKTLGDLEKIRPSKNFWFGRKSLFELIEICSKNNIKMRIIDETDLNIWNEYSDLEQI